MPNAKSVTGTKGSNILIFGGTGGGKTSQFLTLKGKKFAYLFDPNAIDTLAGYDVDYEEFLPDQLDLRVHSLKKKTAPTPGKSMPTSCSYQAWENHFEDSLESGFFDDYENIMIDSLTTFSDSVMDEVLRINGREGQWPQQDDYGPQMNAITKVMRVLTAMGKTVYVTGHYEMMKDKVTERLFFQPLVTGRLKTKLPLLFSQIFFAEAQGASGANKEVQYTLQTKPDRLTPLIRCTMKGLEFKEDVSIDFSRDPEGQGLGGLIKRCAAQAK